MDELLTEIRNCTTCKSSLPNGCRPILSVSPSVKILIIGQAPGIKVHLSGIPWQDKSGDTLRSWLGIDDSIFYDNTIVGIMPMGFCYPGQGKSGDLPPRHECAPLWHDRILQELQEVRLTLLVGQYAQKYMLDLPSSVTLTHTVKDYRNYLPQYLPIPHPSPRNFIWMNKNPWFTAEVIPHLRDIVEGIISE